MPCEALTDSERRCGNSYEKMPYFWFNDSEDVFEKKFKICQFCSQRNFGLLLRTEHELKRTIDGRYTEINYLRKQIKLNGASSKNPNLENQIKTNYEKAKRLQEILKQIRNKTCRLCNYPLKEPADPKYQWSESFSHADLHSTRGYRREILLFHTMCGRIWIMQTMSVDQKIRQLLLPSKTGQFTIEQSLSGSELMMN